MILNVQTLHASFLLFKCASLFFQKPNTVIYDSFLTCRFMSSTAQIKYTRTEHSESSGMKILKGLFHKFGMTEFVVVY